MAAKMNAGILRGKKKVLDEIHQEFEEKLSVFAQQVKTKMETTPAEVANKCFEIALLFLTQAFPNLEDSEQAEMESEEGRLDFDAKLKEMEAKFESKFEDHLNDIGKRQEQIEADLLKVGKEQVKFDDKLEQCDKEIKKNVKEFDDKLKTCDGAIREIREDHEESKKNIKELKESTQCNKNTIAGLRKLQILFKSKLQESKTTPSPQQKPTTTSLTQSSQVSTTTTSTSATQSPKVSTTTTSTVQSFGASAATATLSGTSLSLSQTSTFKVLVRCIEDVKLLSGSLLLLVDGWDSCVKLFNTKGQQLSTLKLQSRPRSLAILNQKSQSCWSVAVALPNSSSIVLVEINKQTLSMKSVINTQWQYQTIAAVNSTTLAAGYGSVVHLIDMSGNVLRSICSYVWPNDMVTTEDQCLIVLDRKKMFYKFNLQQGTQDIKQDISEIQSPRSIACLQSGSFIVADSTKKVLHLVRDDGQYKRVLWKLPSGGDDDDELLRCVTINNKVCVCCTDEGSVYVFKFRAIKYNKSNLAT